MLNQYIVDILVRRIKNGEINPVTRLPMTVEDIKLIEYKNEVERILALKQETPTETVV